MVPLTSSVLQAQRHHGYAPVGPFMITLNEVWGLSRRSLWLLPLSPLPDHAVQWLDAATCVSGSQGLVDTNKMLHRLRLRWLILEKKDKDMSAL